MTNTERIAAAVDDITEQHGLTAGDAIWVFTAMLNITLGKMSPDVRRVLADGIGQSVQSGSLRPLVEKGLIPTEHRRVS